jgi:hypothetical protein
VPAFVGEIQRPFTAEEIHDNFDRLEQPHTKYLAIGRGISKFGL